MAPDEADRRTLDASLVSLLFARTSSSAPIISFIESLHPSSSSSILEPQTSSYPDCTYLNYRYLAFSLCFCSPFPSTSSDLSFRLLTHIDIRSPTAKPPSTKRRKPQIPEPRPTPIHIIFNFPTSNITLPPPKPGEEPQVLERSKRFEVTPDTTGRQFAAAFGEPDRKGGDEKEWTPLWLEWRRVEIVAPVADMSKGDCSLKEESLQEEGKRETRVVGVMVDLQGFDPTVELTEEQKKKGLGGIWDRAASCRWENLKLFMPEPPAEADKG